MSSSRQASAVSTFADKTLSVGGSTAYLVKTKYVSSSWLLTLTEIMISYGPSWVVMHKSISKERWAEKIIAGKGNCHVFAVNFRGLYTSSTYWHLKKVQEGLTFCFQVKLFQICKN